MVEGLVQSRRRGAGSDVTHPFLRFPVRGHEEARCAASHAPCGNGAVEDGEISFEGQRARALKLRGF